MTELLRVITLSDFNTRVVILGAAMLGFTCGVVGALGVLRKRALMGDAIAHSALPGVCVAFLVLGGRGLGGLLAGAIIFGVLGMLCVIAIRRTTRLKDDAATALVLSVSFGLGIALLTIVQRRGSGADHAGLEGFIFGKAAGMLERDAWTIGSVGAIVLGAVVLLSKEFKATCFDSEFHGALGRPTLLLDIVLLGLIALATVSALPAVGVVLVVALLTIPPAASRFWTDRYGAMLAISGAMGSFAGVVGAVVSALAPRLSAGPVITLAATGVFIVSLCCAPRRGLIARSTASWRKRRAIASQNLLRAIFESEERGEPCDERALSIARSWSRSQLRALLRRASRDGMLTTARGTITLTTRGRDAAKKLVRTHRLWEHYLIEHAGIAPDHVDRDADELEHVLPPELIDEIEQRMHHSGGALPHSPHMTSSGPAPGVQA